MTVPEVRSMDLSMFWVLLLVLEKGFKDFGNWERRPGVCPFSTELLRLLLALVESLDVTQWSTTTEKRTKILNQSREDEGGGRGGLTVGGTAHEANPGCFSMQYH